MSERYFLFASDSGYFGDDGYVGAPRMIRAPSAEVAMERMLLHCANPVLLGEFTGRAVGPQFDGPESGGGAATGSDQPEALPGAAPAAGHEAPIPKPAAPVEIPAEVEEGGK